MIIHWTAGVFYVVLHLAILCKYYRERKKDKAKVAKTQKAFDSLLSQKKSSEIRMGKTAENMAPFLNDWPYDPRKFRFLGYPVDGVQFTDNEVIFVEIKTGKSSLTRSQKTARDLVKAGKVKFAVFRIDQDGATLKLIEG